MPEVERLPLEREARLNVEEERLKALPPFKFELTEFCGDSATGTIIYDGRRVAINIEYGSDFPYQRPKLRTADEVVKSYRHVNRAGEICTLRYQPDEWMPDTHTSAVLVERAWRLIANGGVLDEDEEDHLPQPLDFKDAEQAGTIALIPEQMEAEAGGYGRARLAPARTMTKGFVVNKLFGAKGQVVWADGGGDVENRYAGEPKSGSKDMSAVWFAADGDPPYAVDDVRGLERIMPPGLTFNKLTAPLRRGKLKNGRTYPILIQFRDETGLRWATVQVVEQASKRGPPQKTFAYLPSYPVGPEAFFGRVDGLVDRERLAGAHVVVVGIGALGSDIAHQLGRTGVGQITEFDGDVVTPGNPVRSALGFPFLGVGKVFASKFSVEQHLPFVKVTPIATATSSREGRRQLEALLASGNVDLVLVAIGDHQASRGLDALVERYGVPRLYTWTTRGAAAGVVLSVQPETSYEAYHEFVVEEALPDLPEVSEADVPNVPERGCATPVLPGTPIDISTVALHAARSAVEMLQGQTVPFYQCWERQEQAWHSLTLEDIRNAGEDEGTLPSNPHIDTTVLSYEARLSIERSIRASPGQETGGVLLGELRGGELHVAWASGPGDASRQTPTSFELNQQYAQGCIDAGRAFSGGRLSYIGEWHSHPRGGSLSPSADDVRALRKLARSRRANIRFPVILIAGLSGVGELKAEIYTYVDFGAVPVSCEFAAFSV